MESNTTQNLTERVKTALILSFVISHDPRDDLGLKLMIHMETLFWISKENIGKVLTSCEMFQTMLLHIQKCDC